MYNCLIVDDEPMAHKVIEFYCAKDKTLRIAAQAFDAIEAKKYLEESNIEIIFLDINMPEISGLQLLSQIKSNASIILTTAYAEFALDGFELGVTDYLLKPIPEDRFNVAITKAKRHLQSENLNKFIHFKVNGMKIKFLFTDILYFESKGNYLKIITENKSYLTIATLTELEHTLSNKDFIRIHKSYMINTKCLIGITNKEAIKINDTELPIGRTYRMDVLKYMST
jgi:DNA-binding LytR/AlgR family response regulator